jgi:hypothetical protein
MDTQNSEQQPYILSKGESLPTDRLEKLREIQASYSKNKDHAKYRQQMMDLWGRSKISKISEESLFWLGGFVAGEGSLNVSAKKLPSGKLMLDPEFSITQHVNNIDPLLDALEVFKTGRIRYKSGSNATMVFIIDNRTSLSEKVLPFFEKYVNPYVSSHRVESYGYFKQFLELFEQKAHLDLHKMLYEVLPVWEVLRKQPGQFPDLVSAQNYVRENWNSKEKQSKS